MELYFLRHGPAGSFGDPKYKDDSLRPLTNEGRQKIRRISLGMKALGLGFDAILSSPYLRAEQTAAIVARAYKIKRGKIYLTHSLLPPAGAKKLLGEIRRLCPKAEKILLAGHEPHLTESISELLKSPAALAVDFKKGGLCSMTLEGNKAVLNWLLTPAQLVLMGS